MAGISGKRPRDVVRKRKKEAAVIEKPSTFCDLCHRGLIPICYVGKAADGRARISEGMAACKCDWGEYQIELRGAQGLVLARYDDFPADIANPELLTRADVFYWNLERWGVLAERLGKAYFDLEIMQWTEGEGVSVDAERSAEGERGAGPGVESGFGSSL